MLRHNLSFSRQFGLKYFGYFKIFSRGFSLNYHTRILSTETIKKGESVVVYEAPEWRDIEKYLNNNKYFEIIPRDEETINRSNEIWMNCVQTTNFKSKYFALLPFFIEDRQSVRAKKKFVLNMELYPQTKHLKFTLAMISGIVHRYEALSDIAPLTPSDYRTRHLALRSRPPSFMDMDMIYGNRK